ncbi:MAG TPA: hypothetical protein VH092_06805 [Urbifossiella sp.]|jgi:hypothetical protein|nr:hypothetical protein [Urbifossiella sp.]
MTLYRYVGPKRIADRIAATPAGYPIHSPADVRAWVTGTAQELSAGCVTATYVIDAAGTLLIADRRSEHVACAGGRPVRSAGELTFAVGRTVEVGGVTNQSTGYCPEPGSWPVVSAALAGCGLSAPGGFTAAYEFRRCPGCGGITLIKDGLFECDGCGSELPAAYNLQGPTPG